MKKESTFSKPTQANRYNNGNGWLRSGIDYTQPKTQAAKAGK